MGASKTEAYKVYNDCVLDSKFSNDKAKKGQMATLWMG